MKITSHEIREKSFEKNFRGYDKDEVTDFLKILAEQWEILLREKNELERRLEHAEQEAKKLKEVEASLFRTLKTAEDTGAVIIEEAKKTAKEVLKDAHQNSSSMLKSAETQSQKMIEEAELKATEILEAVKANIKGAVRDYDALLNNRLLVIKNLHRLSSDLNETISKSEGNFQESNLEAISGLLEKLEKSQLSLPSKESKSTQAAPSSMEENEATMSEETPSPSSEEPLEFTGEKQDDIVMVESETNLDSNEGQMETEVKNEEGLENIEQSVPEDQDEDQQKNKKEGSFFDQLD